MVISGIFSTVLALAFLYCTFRFVVRFFNPSAYNPKMICGSCEYQGQAKTLTPGTLLVEIVLYIFLIVPGLIYSSWRMSNKKLSCTKCGSTDMLPLDSPKAQRIIKQHVG